MEGKSIGAYLFLYLFGDNVLRENLSDEQGDDGRDDRVYALPHDDGCYLHGVCALHHGGLDVRCAHEHDE